MSPDVTAPRRIVRWRIVACIVIVAQLGVLQGLNTSLEDESWFTGRLSATVEEGPLSLEGVAVNITIDMKENQDDLSIELFGPIRLSHWQSERDGRASLENQETYEEDWNETFSSPTPDEIKSNTHQLIYGSMLVSVVLLVLLLVDFWKQHSGFWLTLGRRLLSFTSMTMVVTIFVMILILLPISWFSTSAGDPELYSENDNSEAFLAHTNFEAETSLGIDGFVLEFEGGGYDIGMVRPANRSAVEAEPPAPGTVDAESYIGVKGEVSTTTPDFLETTMYLWMALWVLIPFLLMVQQRIAIDSNLAPLKFLEEE
ncbi:MAG: hypothetical protein HOJ55_06975 [Euryarchaeota archaeon]|jgi:hypothetical protein|nr:hypothetical protein [Euryarchaeota archaeon]MBT5593573.1 hypothetical protein [Euryarchaeota archaeon]